MNKASYLYLNAVFSLHEQMALVESSQQLKIRVECLTLELRRLFSTSIDDLLFWVSLYNFISSNNQNAMTRVVGLRRMRSAQTRRCHE